MSQKPNPHPAFAPEGVVWKPFSQKSSDGPNFEFGRYAEVLGGWLVRASPSESPVFIPRTERE